jgi:hypothetical protein
MAARGIQLIVPHLSDAQPSLSRRAACACIGVAGSSSARMRSHDDEKHRPPRHARASDVRVEQQPFAQIRDAGKRTVEVAIHRAKPTLARAHLL